MQPPTYDVVERRKSGDALLLTVRVAGTPDFTVLISGCQIAVSADPLAYLIAHEVLKKMRRLGLWKLEAA